MKIYLATWTEQNQGESLTKVGKKERLLSFFFIKDEEKRFLKIYSETGKVPGN